MTDQMFTAKIGEGSFCNGKKLQVSKTTGDILQDENDNVVWI